jgi:hypothetical protein
MQSRRLDLPVLSVVNMEASFNQCNLAALWFSLSVEEDKSSSLNRNTARSRTALRFSNALSATVIALSSSLMSCPHAPSNPLAF